jgi:crotonobetainyl-CoA:carnitine CoA-transferase CaiB-like acyl-CoA transferase
MGRRAHSPEPAGRRQVEAMSAYGVPEADIARVLGIDPKTLRKHYRDELDTGSIKANSRMAENLYRKAMGDGPQAVTATIFWLKTRAQWKETMVSEQTVTHSPILRIVRHIVSPQHQGEDANSLLPAPVPVRLIDQVIEDR